MKFKFLYLGNEKIFNKNNIFNVFNCEYNKKSYVNDYKKNILIGDKSYFNINNDIVSFLGKSYDEFFVRESNNLLDEYILGRELEQEFNIVIFDKIDEGKESYRVKLIKLLSLIESSLKSRSMNRVVFFIRDKEIIYILNGRKSCLNDKVIFLRNKEINLGLLIECVLEFLEESNCKNSRSTKKYLGSSLFFGEANNENYSGEIIMKILESFSEIQNDTSFELTLSGHNDMNLEEISLIEDAISEYIPMNSTLIIRQLTNKVLVDKVKFHLISK